MTNLNKPVRRSTATEYQHRPIIVTLVPCRASGETLIGLRLKGRRTQFVVALSRLYIEMARWHGDKEKAAKREARQQGIKWKFAKRQFNRANQL